MIVQARTELEAINTMLSMIGESPVNSTDLDSLAPGAIARDILREISRAQQSRGFYFNTEEDYLLVRNASNEIQVPINTMGISPESIERYPDTISIRNNTLYNLTTHSYEFEQDLVLDLILGLDFNQLPQTAREYFTMEAAKRFTSRYSQSDPLFKFSNDELKEAREIFLSEDMRIKPRRLLENRGTLEWSRRRVFNA